MGPLPEPLATHTPRRPSKGGILGVDIIRIRQHSYFLIIQADLYIMISRWSVQGSLLKVRRCRTCAAIHVALNNAIMMDEVPSDQSGERP